MVRMRASVRIEKRGREECIERKRGTRRVCSKLTKATSDDTNAGPDRCRVTVKQVGDRLEAVPRESVLRWYVCVNRDAGGLPVATSAGVI